MLILAWEVLIPMDVLVAQRVASDAHEVLDVDVRQLHRIRTSVRPAHSTNTSQKATQIGAHFEYLETPPVLPPHHL